MLTSERQRLMTMYRDEPASALGTLLKRGSFFALAVLLIVVGSVSENEEVANDARGLAPHSESVAKATTAAAHRKEVFDARRARFEAGRDAAGIALVPSAEASMPVTVIKEDRMNIIYTLGLATAIASSQSLHAQGCSGGADGGMDATGNQCNE